MYQTQSPYTSQDFFISGQGNPNTALRKAPRGSTYLDVATGDIWKKSTGASVATGWGILGDIVQTIAAGTVYTLTNTSAAVVFGTTSPVVVLTAAGRWELSAFAQMDNVGATYAANRTLTLKLRRTNNTAADVTGGTVTAGTGVTTTVTGQLWQAIIPPTLYDTANVDDSITLFADVSTAPSAGSSTVYAARITAKFLGTQL